MPSAKKPIDSSVTSKKPIHPHLRLHILISILAVVIFLGSIWIYKINTKSVHVEEIATPAIYTLTKEQLRLIAEKMGSRPSESPPTESDVQKMATKIIKENKGEVRLSTEDLELQAKKLNK
jgi:uncharacterized protein YneF (UPF0154 family)